jgi:guanine nucleotide-binding protein G(I)/G(S)/G(T) subunit beta-1
MSSGDLQARIADAKKKAERLKVEISAARDTKQDGTVSQVMAGKTLPALAAQPKCRRFLKGHFGKVYAMHWAGDSSHLVSASQDGKLIVWNAMSNNKTQAIPLRSSWVMTCAYEQSQGNLVACGGLDNLCSIYQLNQPQVMRAYKELAAHDGYLSCCRFVSESHIITSSGDSCCIYWDIERTEAVKMLNDHSGDVMSVSVLPSVDPNVFVSGSCDATAKVWDIRIGKCTQTFHGHESDINSVALFPNAKSFGTGSDDSSCRLFDMRCYGEVNSFANDKILCGITSGTLECFCSACSAMYSMSCIVLQLRFRTAGA